MIAARGFQAASGHEQENDGAVDFVAPAEVDGRLVAGRMKRSLVVELDVPFEFWSEVVAHD